MTSRPEPLNARCRTALLSFLTMLAALLLPVLHASASDLPAAETRVGVITVAAPDVVGVHQYICAAQQPVRGPSQLQVVSGHCVAAEAGDDAVGVVYRRPDELGGKPYIGQSKSDDRFRARQAKHARANPDAVFRYDELGRARPGTQLDRREESYIRQGGGPTNRGNPNGGLANRRHKMSDQRHWGVGGTC